MKILRCVLEEHDFLKVSSDPILSAPFPLPRGLISFTHVRWCFWLMQGTERKGVWVPGVRIKEQKMMSRWDLFPSRAWDWGTYSQRREDQNHHSLGGLGAGWALAERRDLSRPGFPPAHLCVGGSNVRLPRVRSFRSIKCQRPPYGHCGCCYEQWKWDKFTNSWANHVLAGGGTGGEEERTEIFLCW